MAETSRSSQAVTTQPSVRKNTTTVTQEQITVWGHRKLLFPAPMPDNRLSEPGDQTGFGPGSRLGIATIEGGPVHDQLHNGVAAGLAVPVPGMRGLDFYRHGGWQPGCDGSVRKQWRRLGNRGSEIEVLASTQAGNRKS